MGVQHGAVSQRSTWKQAGDGYKVPSTSHLYRPEGRFGERPWGDETLRA